MALGVGKWYTPVVDKIGESWHRWEKREYTGIVLIMLIVLALHFSTILQPPQPVFDEQYYVPSARYILHESGTDRIEHPPLGQLFIALGMFLFGDNPFGWRVIAVIFGVAGIFLFYLICRQLKMDRRSAYLAAFLLSFENLSFVQSSLGMLDVFSLTFMMASFWLYLRGGFVLAGVAISLAVLSKLTGVLALPIILFYWLLTSRKQITRMVGLTVSAGAAFLLLMPVLDLIMWNRWLSPFPQIALMLKANVTSTFARYPSEMLSRPWDWVVRPEILTYWIDPHYLAMISPSLWALIIPSFVFLLLKAVKGSRAAIFASVWFAGAYLIWIPVDLITDRMTYIYYFYPATGAVCAGLALALCGLNGITANLKIGFGRTMIDSVMPLFLLLTLGAFVLLSPVSYWWKAPLAVAAYLLARQFTSARQPAAERVTSGC
jgi:dolichyl-phosphate-mannose-protein mannosyltransferase